MGEIATKEDLDPAVRVALAYATRPTSMRFTAFFLLDAQLAALALASREVMLTQLRLAWWRDALAGSHPRAANAHPILRATDAAFGEQRAGLGSLVDGWEAAAVDEAATERGGPLADARAGVCSLIAPDAAVEAIRAACAIWTQGSERSWVGDPAKLVAVAPVLALPRDLRPLAVLAGLSRRSLARGHDTMLGDRLSPLVAIRLGIFGR